jgi:two-component sensor histidine kinase
VSALAFATHLDRGARGLNDATHAEYQRQLRSVFAVLRAIVRRSSERDPALEQYAAHLEGRIGALARVHEMLMRRSGVGVDLQELVRAELLSQIIPPAQFTVEGPEIRLSPHSAAPLALTLHEIVTNSLLHGAFSTVEGFVEVRWSRVEQDGAPWLHFLWLERGMQLEAGAPPSRGFGLDVIERTLPYELGARTSLTLTREGAEAVLWIPATAATPIWEAA